MPHLPHLPQRERALIGIGDASGSSAGLNVLFAHADRIEIIASPLLERVLSVCGLTRLVTVRYPRPDGPAGA
ncbi:hypothetical protein [Streptomyces sp. NPDC058295]|uniref:hypothetical protein n=1 Tax=Streptomyces sp. NPDC058295 TaxID=3346431 RepID=UPI0036EA7356